MICFFVAGHLKFHGFLFAFSSFFSPFSFLYVILLFYVNNIYFFSRKQITEDDKALEASVVLSLSANDAHFTVYDYYINSG